MFPEIVSSAFPSWKENRSNSDGILNELFLGVCGMFDFENDVFNFR